MNNQMILEIIKINVFILTAFISLTLILFFSFIKYKEYVKQLYIKKYEKYDMIMQENRNGIHGFPRKDAPIVLNVILDYSESQHVDCSEMIVNLKLALFLIHHLKYKDNKILAFKNVAISQIPGMYELLKEYWYSNDFEESYFSLYYTIYMGHHNQSYMEILEGIFKARFSDDRKTEMIQFMDLDNQILFELCKKYPKHKNILLSSINGYRLTEQQYKQIKNMSPKDYIYVAKQLVVYGAYDLLTTVVKGSDIRLKQTVAYELKNKVCKESFELLCILINDEDFTVRYNAVLGILAYEQGYQYLETVNSTINSEDAYHMAQLHLAMQKKEKQS